MRRPDFSVFELFNAAWCVRTPQPRGTQPRLSCSVVGLLRAPPAPRLRFCRGSASCAFPALSPTRFGLLVATKPHTSGGLAALRVPVGEGVIVPFSGGFAGLFIIVSGYFSWRPADFQQQDRREITWSSVVIPRLVLPALVMTAHGLELPSVSLHIARFPLFALLRH